MQQPTDVRKDVGVFGQQQQRLSHPGVSQVSDDDLASGLLYPIVDRLREVTVMAASAVYEQAFEDEVAQAKRAWDATTLARDAMWWPDYPTFV